MRKRKFYILLPLVICIFAFIIKITGVSYSATNMNYEYSYIRRNMLSHHYITHNSNPSGTILIKTGNREKGEGKSVLTYCAHRDKTLSGKKYAKVDIANTSVKAIKNKKNELTAVINNSYPYITITELKAKLEEALGAAEYARLKISSLDAQEAMTATQAAIWNIIENKDNLYYKYRTTKSVSSISYRYFHKTGDKKWNIVWDKPWAYNIQEGCYNKSSDSTDCGAKSTILLADDLVNLSQVNTYKAKGTTMLEDRINAIIKWYMTLKNTTVVNDIPSFEISDTVEWLENGSQLKVTIKPTSDATYTYDDNYKATFTDLNGQTLSAQATKIEENNQITGYTYLINDITTKGVNITIEATKTNVASNVYVYEADGGWSSSQYLIGADSGSISIKNTLNVLNDGQGQINIYKTKNNKTEVTYGANTPVCGSTTNPCLDGAYLILYANDKKTVIKEFITDTNSLNLTNIPTGTYYLKEEVAPIGYSKSDDLIEITIDNDTIANVTINNKENKICVKKVSSEDTNTIIEGAKFRIEDQFGGAYEEFTSSPQEGVHCLEGQLDSGYYYLIETETPSNYIKSNKRYRFKVGDFNEEDLVIDEVDFDDNLEIVDIEAKNDIITIINDPGVAISKSDITNGACISDAKLTIKNQTGNIIDEWTSSCNEGMDTHQVGLEPGDYTLTETITPTGYATATTIQFTVDKNGKVNKTLDMKDTPINVCILKTTDNSAEGVPGASLEIYTQDGKLYEKMTSAYTPTCFPYMPVGTYTIKEVKAPEGYSIDKEETIIEVKNTSETQNFEIYNKLIVPKTAKNTSKTPIIIAIIFMIFGIGLVGYYGYKKHN